MNNNDIYEVEKEDYFGVLKTLNSKCCIESQEKIDDWHYEIIEKSKLTNKIICKKIVTLDLKKEFVINERYYVINLPEPEESREPTGKMQIELKTPEELKAFFKIISECSKK